MGLSTQEAAALEQELASISARIRAATDSEVVTEEVDNAIEEAEEATEEAEEAAEEAEDSAEEAEAAAEVATEAAEDATEAAEQATEAAQVAVEAAVISIVETREDEPDDEPAETQVVVEAPQEESEEIRPESEHWAHRKIKLPWQK